MKLYNLFCRSEYSYRTAFGQSEKVLDAGGLGICDRGGTWGHVRFFGEAKKRGIKPILGVELPVMDKSNETKVPTYDYRFLAKTQEGLQSIYKITTEATKDDGGRLTRLVFSDIDDKHVAIISPDIDARKAPIKAYVAVTQNSLEGNVKRAMDRGLQPLAGSSNYYPRPEHQAAYEIISPRFKESAMRQPYIMTTEEYLAFVPWAPLEGLENGRLLYEASSVELPTAQMIVFKSKKTLRELCVEGAKFRKVDLKSPDYFARMKRELDMIAEKDFENYFFVLHDMITWAKDRMLVGPARGSSCGSLVCYLLQITDIDPLQYGLLFERFIDITRKDLPDVDIDFQDDRRELVFTYIKEKYGNDRVARIGTINRYKAASAIGSVAMELRVPIKDTEAVKGAMLKRSSGDARAALCILDTFQENQIGRDFISKYPEMKIAAEIENHAHHTGQHAAGIIITQHPVLNYCSVDLRTGTAMVDKIDAEALGLLKIDALGLRTLSVIQDCLDQVKKTRQWLLDYTRDDKKAFAPLNKGQFTGIFQFEGQAVQGLTRQMPIETINDVIVLTALARPGPLVSGSASNFISTRTGKIPIKYLHPLAEDATKDTLGTVVYQEQVMRLGREIGDLEWAEVSELRKIMARSKGKEMFDRYFEKFWVGAKKKKLTKDEAVHIWDHLNTMGSWAFNKSHAVAYGLVSYWCLVLKSKWPLQFAAAQLRNAKSEDTTTQTLRELIKEGFKYVAVDPERSGINWEVQGGVLYGGLMNVNGIGESNARKIIDARKAGKLDSLPPSLRAKLANPVTPFDNVFEAETRWAHLYDEPEENGISGHVWRIGEIQNEKPRKDVVILGKLKTKNVRDKNEAINIQKRGGKVWEGPALALNFVIQDDSGNVKCRIKEADYEDMATPIVDGGIIDESWYLVRGRYAPDYGMFFVDKIKQLDAEDGLS